MKKLLANKRGEGYINTAVIIIIAVVIGGLLLGGLYLVFAAENGVIEQVDDNVYDMFNTGNAVSLKHENEQLLYSYDGETWKNVNITGMGPTDKVTYFLTVDNEDSFVYLAAYNGDKGGTACYSLDGKEWIPIKQSSKGIYLYYQEHDDTYRISLMNGSIYKSTDGINWTLTSTAFY